MFSVYIQNVLGWSPLHTGLGLLPFVGAMALGVRTASGLIGKAGSRPLIMTGMALVAAGATLLAALTGHGGTYAGDLLPGLLVLGVGVGFAFPATTITAMHATSAETAGLASGLTATARELGSAVGVAVLGAVAAGATTIATGDRSAFMVAAVISAALVAIAATLIPSIKPTAGQAAPTHAPSGPVTPHQ